MVFRWQWLLVAWAGLLVAGAAQAASREDRAYAAAVSAYQDGMWSRAETELARFTEKYPDSVHVPQAVLLQAEADYWQKKYPEAIALLSSGKAEAGALADQYVYWIGEAQFQAGDFRSAAATFVSLPEDFPKSTLRLRALVEAAAAHAQLWEWQPLRDLLEPTNGLFQVSAQMDPAGDLVVRGNLLLAQARLAQTDYRGAATILDSLSRLSLRPGLNWQREYILYQVRLAAGETNAAIAATTNLIAMAQADRNDGWQAEGLDLRATLQEQIGERSAALATYQEMLALNVSGDQVRKAILKIAELAIAQHQYADAMQSLEKYLASFPASPANDVAMLTLGELQLKDYVAQPAATNRLALAQTQFDQFTRVYTNSPLLGKAYLDYGWCLWLAGRAPESFAEFQEAARRLPMSEDLALARFKMGDALFAENDYTNAVENYRAVIDGFSDFPAVMQALGDRALYQILRANLQLDNYAGASDAMARILKLYPSSQFAGSGLLLVGEGLADARRPAAARVQFEKFVEEFPTNALLPRVELAIARTYEQEQNWPAAIHQYENWRAEFPTNALRAQADYALANANFQAGNQTNAFQLFTNFVAEFPANDLAPQAQFWVADHYFNLGGTNYVDAERNYKILYQNTNWQAIPLVRTNLAYQARLMAGRAAMGLSSYKDAIDQFTSVTSDTNCPLADLNAQALFAYGSVLMQMDSPDTNNLLANYQLAINVFNQLCQSYPTNTSGVQAWSEIGYCYLQLTNFDGATNAFAQVFNSPYADVSARSQAEIGFGIALEKKADLATGDRRTQLLQEALNHYLNVFDTSVGKNLRDGEVADPFWVKKAGLQALPLVEALGLADPNRFFDHLERLFPQLKDLLEKKKSLVMRGH